MKKLKLTALVFFLIATSVVNLAPSIAQNANINLSLDKDKIKLGQYTQKPQYVEGEVIVKFKKQYVNTQLGISSRFQASNGLDLASVNNSANTVALKITDGSSVEAKVNQLKNRLDVEYAEPNYIYAPFSLGTNDPLADELWGLHNIGQTIDGKLGAVVDADMDVPEAWSMSMGQQASPKIIVAVIDTGVGYMHPDLQPNMWVGNNCVDWNGAPMGGCIHGYDFEDDDKNPVPNRPDSGNSHGTHVAGTIAAVRNNGVGISGVAPNAQIMALRTSLASDELVKAIDFATQNGARIINASYGGSVPSVAQYEAMERFRDAGGLFVAAAGNEASNNDTTPMYPASYDLDNIISVAATNFEDLLANFSNYGETSVHVGAPGVDIISTISDQILYSNNFQAVDPFVGWTMDPERNWGTVTNIEGETFLIADSTDVPNSYLADQANYLTSPNINTSAMAAGRLQFILICETENTPPIAGSDYLGVQYFNGSSFVDTGEYYNYQNADGIMASLPISSTYAISNFAVRLTWNTNAADNNYLGCLIDDFEVISHTNGSNAAYEHQQGTSMAAPNVAGVAALVWGASPDLTYSEVRTILLEEGDTMPSLVGETSTGKRVNAFNSLMQVAGGCVPVANPVGGDFSAQINVSLTTPLCPGAAIYFTTDGTEPTLSSTVYAAPIEINPAGGTLTLRAISQFNSQTSGFMTQVYAFPIQVEATFSLEGNSSHIGDAQALVCLSGDCTRRTAEYASGGFVNFVFDFLTAGSGYEVYVKPAYYLSQSNINYDLVVGQNELDNLSQFLAGDFNNDDIINALDYGLLEASFGDAGIGDINRDGVVNTLDFAVLYKNFGETGSYLYESGGTLAWPWDD